MKPIGQYWEQQAEHFLMQHQLEVIARNCGSPCGETDLIMRDAKHIAFIEVRYRRSDRFGGATNSVTATKRRHCSAVPRYSSAGKKRGHTTLAALM